MPKGVKNSGKSEAEEEQEAMKQTKPNTKIMEIHQHPSHPLSQGLPNSMRNSTFSSPSLCSLWPKTEQGVRGEIPNLAAEKDPGPTSRSSGQTSQAHGAATYRNSPGILPQSH